MKKDWMIKESELDDDQIKVLMATLDKSCVVSGCAGSGKSVLALIKAQRIQKERGDNYEIIVYTKALCNYMNSGRKELGLNKPFYYYWQWKNRLICSPADYVIVDEIQDFTKEEVEEFISAAKRNFFFFGDTAQSIYQGLKDTMPVEAIGYLLPFKNKPKDFTLYRNYRLPIPVAKFVQYIGVDLPSFDETTYRSQETKVPYLLKYKDIKEQLVAIKRIIGDKLDDVAILVPHNEMVRTVGNVLREIGMNFEQKYQDKEDWRNSVESLNFGTTNPKIMTYHSAKGLQFETVFLPMLECYQENIDPKTGIDSNRKSLYVAMTRTYKNLYMMYSGYLPKTIINANIPVELYRTTELDDFEDI